MNPYTIEVSKSKYQRNLKFWGVVGFLKQQSTEKVFARLTLKSKAQLDTPQDWEFYEATLNANIDVSVKKEQPINKVTDEHGNVYYEVTDLV